jgi:hypothetical protein
VRALAALATFGLALLLLSGCAQKADTSGDALRKAGNYLAKNGNPEMNGMAVYMVDMGETWRLAYWAPQDEEVPAMIVVVNKKAGNVVHFERRRMWKGQPVP